MKNLRFIFALSILITTFSCNNSKEKENKVKKTHTTQITDTQIKDFENKLTEDGFFWESGIKEFLFQKDGTVICYFPQQSYEGSKHTNGKWSFDQATRTLSVAWQGKKQYSVNLFSISEDWNWISTWGRIEEYSSDNGLKRMKLIDNRFEKD